MKCQLTYYFNFTIKVSCNLVNFSSCTTFLTACDDDVTFSVFIITVTIIIILIIVIIADVVVIVV